MKWIIKIGLFAILSSMVLVACEEIKSYPETPSVKYVPPFNLFKTTDVLGNEIIIGKLKFEFTDGDGDLGIDQPDSSGLPDSLSHPLALLQFVQACSSNPS